MRVRLPLLLSAIAATLAYLVFRPQPAPLPPHSNQASLSNPRHEIRTPAAIPAKSPIENRAIENRAIQNPMAVSGAAKTLDPGKVREIHPAGIEDLGEPSKELTEKELHNLE